MSIVLLGSTSGSCTLQEQAIAGTTVLTLPTTSGTVITTASTAVVTQAMLGTNVAGNGPSFSAYLNSSQTLSSATITKITFDVELWDTNNNFASSRFTPTVAGYYQINALINVNTTGCRVYLAIYKNGSIYQTGPDSGLANVYAEGISSIVFCNGTTDYIEIYGQFGVGQAVSASNLYTWFNAAMVRSA